VLRCTLGEHVAARLNERDCLFPGRLDGGVLGIGDQPEAEVVGVLVLVLPPPGAVRVYDQV
jgi:hypothetical protein